MPQAVTEGRRVVDDATCLGCSCLCDDIGLVVEGGRIVEARRACNLGRAWFETEEIASGDVAGPMIEGVPVPLDVALDRAAEILKSARSPMVWGLGGSTIEAQRVALAIADRIGAIVATSGDRDRSPRRGFVRVGAVGATLGEVKARADLIVYVGGLPSDRLPRFQERYAEDAAGRFIAGERSVIVVDGPDSDDQWAALFSSLRAIVNEVSLDAKQVERATGQTLAGLVHLAEQCKAAAYGAFVVVGIRGGIAHEAFLALVRDLNAFTRFVAIVPPEGEGRDLRPGAEAVMTWGSGFPNDVDFSPGFPRSLPGDGALDRLNRGEIDAVMIVEDGEELPAIEGLPRVVIGGRSTTAGVWIPSASPGIDEGGSVLRFDGVMLPLRPPFAGRRMSGVETLRGIEARLTKGAG